MWTILFAVSAAGYGGIWRDTGRYREIPGDTRGYDEIRSPHDVFTTTSVKRETANRTRRANFALRRPRLSSTYHSPLFERTRRLSFFFAVALCGRRPGALDPLAVKARRESSNRDTDPVSVNTKHAINSIVHTCTKIKVLTDTSPSTRSPALSSALTLPRLPARVLLSRVLLPITKSFKPPSPLFEARLTARPLRWTSPLRPPLTSPPQRWPIQTLLYPSR